jgi:hypothetical protein
LTKPEAPGQQNPVVGCRKLCCGDPSASPFPLNLPQAPCLKHFSNGFEVGKLNRKIDTGSDRSQIWFESTVIHDQILD